MDHHGDGGGGDVGGADGCARNHFSLDILDYVPQLDDEASAVHPLRLLAFSSSMLMLSAG